MRAALTLPERPVVVHLLAVLDVLVLLLVFFVLITSVAQETGVSVVDLPAGEFRLRNYGPKVVVTARGGAIPAVYVGLQRVALDDLESVLQASANEVGAETLLLLADKMLPVAVERRIIETGRRLGLNVMLVGQREAGEPIQPAPEPAPVATPEDDDEGQS